MAQHHPRIERLPIAGGEVFFTHDCAVYPCTRISEELEMQFESVPMLCKMPSFPGRTLARGDRSAAKNKLDESLPILASALASEALELVEAQDDAKRLAQHSTATHR